MQQQPPPEIGNKIQSRIDGRRWTHSKWVSTQFIARLLRPQPPNKPLAISMTTLSGKVIKMQVHIIEHQSEKVNTRGEIILHRGTKHSYFASCKVAYGTYPGCTHRTHYPNPQTGRMLMKRAGPPSSPSSRYEKGPQYEKGDNINSKTIKTGWDRIGGADHKLI